MNDDNITTITVVVEQGREIFLNYTFQNTSSNGEEEQIIVLKFQNTHILYEETFTVPVEAFVHKVTDSANGSSHHGTYQLFSNSILLQVWNVYVSPVFREEYVSKGDGIAWEVQPTMPTRTHFPDTFAWILVRVKESEKSERKTFGELKRFILEGKKKIFITRNDVSHRFLDINSAEQRRIVRILNRNRELILEKSNSWSDLFESMIVEQERMWPLYFHFQIKYGIPGERAFELLALSPSTRLEITNLDKRASGLYLCLQKFKQQQTTRRKWDVRGYFQLSILDPIETVNEKVANPDQFPILQAFDDVSTLTATRWVNITQDPSVSYFPNQFFYELPKTPIPQDSGIYVIYEERLENEYLLSPFPFVEFIFWPKRVKKAFNYIVSPLVDTINLKPGDDLSIDATPYIAKSRLDDGIPDFKWTLTRKNVEETPLINVSGTRLYTTNVNDLHHGLYTLYIDNYYIQWQVLISLTCKRTGTQYYPDENPWGQARWHTSQLNLKGIAAAPTMNVERNPLVYYGLDRKSARWACCHQSALHPGCWVGDYNWKTHEPQLHDTYAGIRGSEWIFHPNTSSHAHSLIEKAKLEGNTKEVLRLEGRFNAIMGGILNPELPEDPCNVKYWIFSSSPPSPIQWSANHKEDYEYISEKQLEQYVKIVEKNQRICRERKMRGQLPIAQIARLFRANGDEDILTKFLVENNVDGLYASERDEIKSWRVKLNEQQEKIQEKESEHKEVVDILNENVKWFAGATSGIQDLKSLKLDAQTQIVQDETFIVGYVKVVARDEDSWKILAENRDAVYTFDFLSGKLAKTQDILNDLESRVDEHDFTSKFSIYSNRLLTLVEELGDAQVEKRRYINILQGLIDDVSNWTITDVQKEPIATRFKKYIKNDSKLYLFLDDYLRKFQKNLDTKEEQESLIKLRNELSASKTIFNPDAVVFVIENALQRVEEKRGELQVLNERFQSNLNIVLRDEGIEVHINHLNNTIIPNLQQKFQSLYNETIVKELQSIEKEYMEAVEVSISQSLQFQRAENLGRVRGFISSYRLQSERITEGLTLPSLPLINILEQVDTTVQRVESMEKSWKDTDFLTVTSEWQEWSLQYNQELERLISVDDAEKRALLLRINDISRLLNQWNGVFTTEILQNEIKPIRSKLADILESIAKEENGTLSGAIDRLRASAERAVVKTIKIVIVSDSLRQHTNFNESMNATEELEDDFSRIVNVLRNDVWKTELEVAIEMGGEPMKRRIEEDLQKLPIMDFETSSKQISTKFSREWFKIIEESDKFPGYPTLVNESSLDDVLRIVNEIVKEEKDEINKTYIQLIDEYRELARLRSTRVTSAYKEFVETTLPNELGEEYKQRVEGTKNLIPLRTSIGKKLIDLGLRAGKLTSNAESRQIRYNEQMTDLITLTPAGVVVFIDQQIKSRYESSIFTPLKEKILLRNWIGEVLNVEKELAAIPESALALRLSKFKEDRVDVLEAEISAAESELDRINRVHSDLNRDIRSLAKSVREIDTTVDVWSREMEKGQTEVMIGTELTRDVYRDNPYFPFVYREEDFDFADDVILVLDGMIMATVKAELQRETGELRRGNRKLGDQQQLLKGWVQKTKEIWRTPTSRIINFASDIDEFLEARNKWTENKAAYTDLQAKFEIWKDEVLPRAHSAIMGAINRKRNLPFVDQEWNRWLLSIEPVLQDRINDPLLGVIAGIVNLRIKGQQEKDRAKEALKQFLLKYFPSLLSVRAWSGVQRAIHETILEIQTTTRGKEPLLSEFETEIHDNVVVTEGIFASGAALSVEKFPKMFTDKSLTLKNIISQVDSILKFSTIPIAEKSNEGVFKVIQGFFF